MSLPVLFSDTDALGVDVRNPGQQVIKMTAGEGLQPVPCAIIHERREEVRIEHTSLRGEDTAFFYEAG